MCPCRKSSSRRPTQQEFFGETGKSARSEEHTSELQSPDHLVCRLLLEKKKTKIVSDKIVKSLPPFFTLNIEQAVLLDKNHLFTASKLIIPAIPTTSYMRHYPTHTLSVL